MADATESPGTDTESTEPADPFARLAWDAKDESFVLDGHTYLVEDVTTRTDPDAFRFYKPRSMVEQYQRFLAITGLRPDAIVELGIFDGGSVAFWMELLSPSHYLAVDKDTRGDSELFTRFVAERGLADRVQTEWGVDQADIARLSGLLDGRGLDEVDLIIDDASHSYGPTLHSFLGLFPRVREGGYYIIEDWSWVYREPYCRKDHPWALRPGLVTIVHDVLGALGSGTDAISEVLSYPDFVAIRRGPEPLRGPFGLEAAITPRERPWGKLALDAGKRYGRKALGSVKRG